VLGTLGAPEATRDLLGDLDHPHVSFAEVVVEGTEKPVANRRTSPRWVSRRIRRLSALERLDGESRDEVALSVS
jgi:hypothetical protein